MTETGTCAVCGQVWFKEEHVHGTYGTLSPERAAQHWEERARNAPKSWE